MPQQTAVKTTKTAAKTTRTTAKTTTSAAPEPVIADTLTLGERVAQDLATLGALAKTSPELADLIATTVSQLCLVIPQHGAIRADEVLAAAAELGASEPHVSQDGWFAARDVDLPAGVIRLSVINLQPPAEADDTPSGE